MPIQAYYAAHHLKDLDSSHIQDFQLGVDFAKEFKPYQKLRLKSGGGGSELKFLMVIEHTCGM